MAAAISLRRLTKEFPVPFRRRRIAAVRDLSLEVAPGQVYGLLGPNGSGKSTTMKMVLGLVSPTAGEVEVFGLPADRVAGRAGIGFLPEGSYFYRWLTGEETLRFYGRLGGRRGAALRERVRELLHRVGLEDAADRRLGGYSRGMLQRIGLAQALLNDPRLLVLDEPTAGVDPAGARAIKELILDCKARGITVLLCSHLLAQVQEVCDRIGILDRGSLRREGSVEELLGVPGRTELTVEDAPPGLADEFAAWLRERHPAARFLGARSAPRSLEEYFLEVTGDEPTRPDQPASTHTPSGVSSVAAKRTSTRPGGGTRSSRPT